jgi:hypothetical protein
MGSEMMTGERLAAWQPKTQSPMAVFVPLFNLTKGAPRYLTLSIVTLPLVTCWLILGLIAKIEVQKS